MLVSEQRWVSSILASFAPSTGPGLAPRAGEVDYLKAFQTMYEGGTPLFRLGLRLGLWLVVVSPLFTMARLRTLPGLPAHERTAQLERLLEHRVFPLREATFLFKTLASLALLGSPAVRARSRYDGEAREVREPTDARKALPMAQGDL